MADWRQQRDPRDPRDIQWQVGRVHPAHGGYHDQSNPGYDSGIRAPVPLQELSNRVARLEKIVKDALHENNNWNTLLREWQNKNVEIELMSENIVEGKLLWFDRYTVCLEEEEMYNDKLRKQKVIVHKGAIAVIRLASDTRVVSEPPK